MKNKRPYRHLQNTFKINEHYNLLSDETKKFLQITKLRSGTWTNESLLEIVRLSMPHGVGIHCQSGYPLKIFKKLIAKGKVKVVRPGSRMQLCQHPKIDPFYMYYRNHRETRVVLS